MNYVQTIRHKIGQERLILVGGRVILQREDKKILLHKRTDFLNVWSLPGGSAEPGESLEEAMTREVKEETGLTMKSLYPIGFSCNPKLESFSYPNGDQVQLFAMIFWCREWKGKLTPNVMESPTLDFFDIRDLPQLRKNELVSIQYFRHYLEKRKFISY